MLVIAVFLSTTNKLIVDAIAKPFKERNKDGDFWWLFYVSLVTGAVIGWFSQINLFVDYVPEAVIGRVLTAVLIGGGATLIHDVLSSGVGALNAVGKAKD
jgi:hypothetical protein